MSATELIERDDFLERMENQFKKTVSGEGHTLFITGDAGIGKTAVVRAFLKKVEHKCTVYTGACDSLFTPRPLAPLYDLALQIQEDFAGNIQSIPSRTELFVKFAAELTGKNKPIVLVFEDIHWADEATLDFVKFFARRISRTKCLFILTYRDDEVNQQHPLRNVLGELSPDTFNRIPLTTLSREAVQKMALERGYDGEDVYSISGGNPFYVNEILASYSTGIPDNIKDAVLSVYNRLNETTRAVWQLVSVIPEGFEVTGPGRINPEYNNALNECLEKKVVYIKNEKIFFKHELFRRTIENSLSPFKRIELNKTLLRFFIKDFENSGEIERIVHHAKNANENDLVVKYAPLAAANAACVGAHIEAAKLYLTAIEFSPGNNDDQLVLFYEAYAYECYLTSQIKDAIIFQGKALKIWKAKENIEQVGNSLRLLSRYWWFDGNGSEAEKYAAEAIGALQSLPSSSVKAMAFSNMSQLKMLSDQSDQSVEWGNKAIEIAIELNNQEILSHALNNVGTAKMQSQIREYQQGKQLLLQSLDIALQNSLHEHAARAYTNIISSSIATKEYEMAKQYLEEGLKYCEERDLNSWTRYKLSWKARMLLETGYWDDAVVISQSLLNTERQPAMFKIGALTILAVTTFRKGGQGASGLLSEAKQLAFATKEHQRILPVVNACLEFEWVSGEKLLTSAELTITISLIKNVDNIFRNSEAEFWLKKTGHEGIEQAVLFEPYRLLAEGDFANAAEYWHSKGCSYEEALFLFEGNEEDKRKALSLIEKLGATAVLEKMKTEMRFSGIKKIPRGKRESTKNNPVQLTNRELDVLQLLKKGIHNKEIANSLYISPKTVDHHISSILFKLDVNTRVKAVDEAARLGILK